MQNVENHPPLPLSAAVVNRLIFGENTEPVKYAVSGAMKMFFQ